VTTESFTICKKTILKDAQTLIFLLLQKIKNHRFPKYPTQQKIIQPKTHIKFAATREVRGNCAGGKKMEVTDSTPSTKIKDPTPVSMEKRSKGGGVAKKRKKLWSFQKTNSRHPKRNKGRITSLNEDALVPLSDVESDRSHYSLSESTYRSSDGSKESEASEEEGQATKNLTTYIMEQPIDNEQLVQKNENIIKQKPGSTTKQPAIGQRPKNEETVGGPVVTMV
jgi:hypothetical protein